MAEFHVITVFFNPSNFKSLLNNYYIFRDNLEKQGVKLTTVELAFNGKPHQIVGDTIKLTGNSIMWQKERLINYAVERLPDDCKYYAWIDCDVIFSNNYWQEQAISKLEQNDVVQLFKRVFYLPRGHKYYSGKHEAMLQGVIWQEKIHKNWLNRRKNKDLPFSSPGFAWAVKRETFPNGIYDKNIIGSGDTFFVDCLLDSWDIHGYAQKFNEKMKLDMMNWRSSIPKLTYDYIPVDICHLWHGSLKNRRYMDRHDMIKKYDYDPQNDIVIRKGVYEWNSPKFEFHEDIVQYFLDRKEDDDE